MPFFKYFNFHFNISLNLISYFIFINGACLKLKIIKVVKAIIVGENDILL